MLLAAGALRGMWSSTPLRCLQAWHFRAVERCVLCTPRAPGPQRRALCMLRAAAAPSLAPEQAQAAPAGGPAPAAKPVLSQEDSAAAPATSGQAVGGVVLPLRQPAERKQRPQSGPQSGQTSGRPRQQPGARRYHTSRECLIACLRVARAKAAGVLLRGCMRKGLN